MSRREMLEWSQAGQKGIQDACNDTASWTALDEITRQHNYSFKSIAAWPVDGCLVCKPTERAAMLLGSLQAACNVGVIKEDLGVSVTAVVSMCETDMNVHGAPSNWNDYFREHDVVHIHCQLDDITVKQPGRDLERHKALQKNCLSEWKSICFQLWQQSVTAINADKPMNILFHCFGGINRSAAVLCAWLIATYDMATARKMRSNCCLQRDRLFARGAIETMFWRHCGWWNNSAVSGTGISDLTRPSSHLLVRWEPETAECFDVKMMSKSMFVTFVVEAVAETSQPKLFETCWGT